MVEDILQQNGDALAGALATQTSLSAEQATGFLPVALHEVVAKLGGADLASILGGADVVELIQRLDVAGIARRAGLAEGEAREGLQSILPVLLEALRARTGGVGGLLSSAQAGPGGIGGRIISKLFGD